MRSPAGNREGLTGVGVGTTAHRGRAVVAGATDDALARVMPGDVLVVTMTTPSQAFARGERADGLRVALESLPEVPREALRLRYVEGLPTKEIAALLGKTDGAVRVLLTRSLQRLQALLG